MEVLEEEGFKEVSVAVIAQSKDPLYLTGLPTTPTETCNVPWALIMIEGGLRLIVNEVMEFAKAVTVVLA